MRTKLANGETVIGRNSFEADGFKNGRVISGEKAMSDEDWESYQSEIRTGHRFVITLLVVGLGGAGALLVQHIVNYILG